MKKIAAILMAVAALGWLLAIPAGELSLALNQTATNDATLVADGTKFVTTAIPDSDAVGQVLRYDTATNAFSVGTLTDADVPDEDTKCINIDPANATTDWFFYRAERALTVTGIDCIVDAATSVVLTLRECDANGASCTATEAAITCAATNTTEASGIDNAAVDAGDILRVLRGTVTGGPAQAFLCFTYTVP